MENKELQSMEDLEQINGGFYHGESREKKIELLRSWKRRGLELYVFKTVIGGMSDAERAEAEEIWKMI